MSYLDAAREQAAPGSREVGVGVGVGSFGPKAF